ncbi:MAG TPA: hypothetical protein DCL86_12840 [Bacteroidales bacterium]|nr:hypothetical protein [Bacteroidales bacterium]
MVVCNIENAFVYIPGNIAVGIVFILRYACMVKVMPIVEKVVTVITANSIINRYQLIALVMVGE